MSREHCRGREHAGGAEYRVLAAFAQGLVLSGARRIDFNGEGDVALAHLDAAHHAERDNAFAPRRVFDGPQNVENILLFYTWHP